LEIALHHQSVEDVLLYDWLSDGERMFLGRISLFYLLQNQHDALFILDEPETHFNDAWKRQMVDIIDDAMKDLSNEVVISTHSSIALTDVFAQEIHLLKKENGETILAKITTPTFGADPSEIMVNLFDAPDSIGKRALEYLDEKLAKDWKLEEIDELESLIHSVGPGYHRSELRTIWRRLHAISD
jgi:predicted ATP-binding protein involved in virulence